MRELLEPEEQVGRLWHRLIGRAESYPFYEDAAVELGALRGGLAVFFRGLGGVPGLELAAGVPRSSPHRLRLRQRIGLERERLETAERNAERVLLPARIGCFPTAELNRKLYVWLTAFLAVAGEPLADRPQDPLQADLAFLHRACWTSARVCQAYPGLKCVYAELCAALLAIRPRRLLPPVEAAVEEVVLSLLGRAPAGERARILHDAVAAPAPDLAPFGAPRRYRSFLPVPLWGEISTRRGGAARSQADEPGGGKGQDGEDGRRRRARRRAYDQAQRNDPFVLINKGELLLLAAEMVNVNRPIDDEDEDAAKAAANDLEELAITEHKRRTATRLRLDLDLEPGNEQDAAPVRAARFSYPEWDYWHKAYREDHCAVFALAATEEGEAWKPDAAACRRIRRVRRQFEALRPKRETVHRQLDGPELDTDALVRARCDLVASGIGSDRIYEIARNQARDLAVAFLVDVSLSTDSWVANRRVLDVEKEALTALAFGLAACGDDFAIQTFTSRKRGDVRVETVKGFDEPLSGRVVRRISALRPGYYTRMGAAVRHVSGGLIEQPQRHRLLLLLTDGKPNDLDRYDGRYGVEDTRKAIQEARQAGLAVFGVTIDRKGQDYFPYVFGRGGYAMVSQIDRLPQALPVIYRHLVS